MLCVRFFSFAILTFGVKRSIMKQTMVKGGISMYKRILLGLDLEGVNHVVGEPYEGLSKGSEQWQIACKQAMREIHEAADALFAAGAEKVDLWDQHGGGDNIDPQDVDERVTLLRPDLSRPTMYFVKDSYDCICYFGQHAMEGTLGGVLAHTMNSKRVQYYKLNGQYIGEIDMQAYIAAAYGIPSVFSAAGDIACAQAKRVIPELVTVVTKQELSRNQAIFRENSELFAEIREKIVEAVKREHPCKQLAFPATMEKAFKRTEDAAKYLSRLLEKGIDAKHPEDEILGKDAHAVVSVLHSIEDLIACR